MDEDEVKCCIHDELVNKGLWSQERKQIEERPLMDKVLKNINFLPDNDPWYSEFGCKPVKKAIALID